MKKIISLLFFTLSVTLVVGQKIEVELSHFQLFSHDKNLETNYAIKNNKVSYGDAFYTNTRLIFDLKKKYMIKTCDNQSDTLLIREIRRNSDVLEVDVIFPDPLLVNYFLTTTKKNKEDILVCRWIEGDKIVGWADKFIKIKRGL
jgi:hypothetical protein